MVRAGEDLSANALTVNERVLLHLRESGLAPDVEDAFPATQPGIAETLGIRVNHVSRAVKQLIELNLLAEGTTRVHGEVRRRKAYALTPHGRELGRQLASEIGPRTVTALDETGSRTLIAAEARRFLVPSTYTRLLSALDRGGNIDLRAPAKSAAPQPPRFEEGRPPPTVLVGRENEAAAFRRWLSEGPPILAVLGPRGIGKSALMSSCLDGAGPRFWWTVRGSDSSASLLRGLAAFLAILGKRDLRARAAKGPLEARDTAKILARDLRESNAILVFDDVQAAGSDVVPYVDTIVQAAAAAGCRVAVASESPLPQRGSYLADGLLTELRLAGLDRAAARAIVPHADTQEFEKAYRLTQGHPLPLKLAVAESAPGGFSPEERAILKVLKVREDEG